MNNKYGVTTRDKRLVEEEYLRMKQRARQFYKSPPKHNLAKFLHMWQNYKDNGWLLFEWGKHADYFPVVEKPKKDHGNLGAKKK